MPSLPKRLRGAAAQPPSAAAPGSTPRPEVKRLNNKPLIIGGSALAFVVLAVAFFVTSKPPAADPAAAGMSFPASAPATAEFLNTDPEPNDTIPGPDCQGLDCAAAVAAGQPDGVLGAAPAVAPPAGLVVDPATGALVDPATGTVYTAQGAGAPAGVVSYPVGDPYAASYGPEPQAAAPAAAPATQECDRSCRYREARAARLGGADASSTAAAPAAPAPTPGPDGLMPESYYAAQADSVMRAEIARLTGGGDSGPNQRSAPAAVQQQPAAQAAPPAPSSPYVVPAGTLIPAALVTGINSDICGDVKAVVTRDVFDARQRLLVVPAGTELLGSCGNSVSAGQARLAVAWTRLRLPDGRSVSLPGLPTHSPTGESGVRDRVNNHWGRVFGTAVLLSAIGAGVQLGIPQETDGGTQSPSQTAGTAAATELSTLATEILRRNLEVKPTIEIRPATPFTVFVAADLDVGAPVRRRGSR